jgi:hypothetical protein
VTAQELLDTLRARGVRLRVKGDRLAYEAPPATLTPGYRNALVTMKPGIIEILRAEPTTDWTRVSLWQLDKVLEVAVPWSDVRLLIAPGCRIARQLRATDPKPGRVWCSCEVLNLLLSGVTPEDARKVAATRLDFDATIRGVFPTEKAREGKA